MISTDTQTSNVGTLFLNQLLIFIKESVWVWTNKGTNWCKRFFQGVCEDFITQRIYIIMWYTVMLKRQLTHLITVISVKRMVQIELCSFHHQRRRLLRHTLNKYIAATLYTRNETEMHLLTCRNLGKFFILDCVVCFRQCTSYHALYWAMFIATLART